MRQERVRRRSTKRLTREHWLALGAILVFSSVLGHDFVYDDAWTVVENRWLDRPFTELLGLLASGGALAKGVPDATRPAMVFSLWLDRRIFGDSAFGPHLVSLLLYGLTCALAMALAARVTRRRSVALVTGGFFAFAPLHAEPIAAVNYREDLLAAVGILGAWLLVLGKVRERKRNRDSWQRALGATASWTLALFAKESAVVLVPLLVVTAFALPRERDHFRKKPLLLGGVLFVGLVWAVFRARLAQLGDDIPLAPARSAAQTALRSVRFSVETIRHALFPLDWAPDHWRQPDAGALWLIPLLILLAGVVVLLRMRRGRIAGFGLLVAWITALPASPLVGPVNEIADRYFFLAVFGGGIVWGSTLAFVADRARLRGRRQALIALLCLALVVPAWQATSIWRNERTLWTAAVERQPDSPRAWAALSRVYRLAGDHRAAADAVERALALDSSYAPALVTRVYNEIAGGTLEQARAHVAEIERRGMKDYRGVSKARRCLTLEAEAAQRCVDH